jgi:hypothetical protein
LKKRAQIDPTKKKQEHWKFQLCMILKITSSNFLWLIWRILQKKTGTSNITPQKFVSTNDLANFKK